ncbi:MAG: hypothetical protein KDB80_09155 [Planctomycetes bacterium]|nr:hypothetical protein [Planctomycetota bacterium]
MLETARDQGHPWLHQLSFFLANRVGSLEKVSNALSEADVRICGISILDAHDHAVVRLIVDDPGKAEKVLESQDRTVCVTRVLGVVVDDKLANPIGALLDPLLRAELSVCYAYALIARPNDEAVVALLADNVDMATRVLRKADFKLISQRDLQRD